MDQSELKFFFLFYHFLSFSIKLVLYLFQQMSDVALAFKTNCVFCAVHHCFIYIWCFIKHTVGSIMILYGLQNVQFLDDYCYSSILRIHLQSYVNYCKTKPNQMRVVQLLVITVNNRAIIMRVYNTHVARFIMEINFQNNSVQVQIKLGLMSVNNKTVLTE